jgi:8-oxo-dGTP diphosphatase
MAEIPRDVDAVDWDAWQPAEQAVLCFIRGPGRILLIHKKTGLGHGKVNGPGGRIERGELPAQAAVRETREETGVTPAELSEVATLSFLFTDGYSLRCVVFFASAWTGELAETREAAPFWCAEQAVPYDRMWEDDALWLPLALRGAYVVGHFVFESDRMLSHRVVSRDEKA